MQNGTGEEVKKIVSTLNAGEVPSGDVVGEWILVDTLLQFICGKLWWPLRVFGLL